MNMLILKVLILGGTNFLGPHLVDELQQRGHEVTLFNRGTQDLSRFQNVEHLKGDRDGDLTALEGRVWDVVIDTCGHLPRVVGASSQILCDAARHYTYISSIGAHADFHQLGITEEYPLAELEDPNDEVITEQNYGALKAACEQVVQNYFPNSALIVRPGLIVGPYDLTDRFTYWANRISKGGDVLAPGNPATHVQFIDVRDLSKWIVDHVESEAVGAYNVTGKPISFESFLTECQKVSQSDVTLHWVSEDFLIEHHVQDWIELPMWLSSARNMPGFFNVNTDKATQAGLAIRPLCDTIAATLKWDTERENVTRQFGLSEEREQELLELWQSR